MKMISPPLVTVLLPCYNAMPYLPEALESIMNQSHQNLEILCIDDGSTDDTGRVLEDYAARDERFRVIHNESNLRLIRTLNKGIELARGEYIARMDADDISLPDRIENQLKLLAERKVDLVSSSVILINEKGEALEIIYPRGYSQLTIEWLSLFINPMGHPSVMAKTETFRSNPYLEEDRALHAEDYEIWARMLRAGVKMANSKAPTIKYRVNPHSVSIQNTAIQNENFSRCVQEHIQKFTGFPLDFHLAKIISNRFQDCDVKFSDIKQAFRYIRKMRGWYILNKGIAEEKIIARIRAIGLEQKFDILIQFYKKGKGYQKVQSAGLMLWIYISGFRYIGVSEYLKSKFYSKYSREIKAQYRDHES